jgi:glucan 1,3-beta-glucosidase
MIMFSSWLRAATLAIAALSTTSVIADSTVHPGFPYGSQKVRGVNLGGWLVLEPWITPSLFEKAGNGVIDEWTFGQYQSKSAAQSALQQHWDTWITEQDFADIAAAGLNHVRVPIGFWAFDVSAGEPYVQGQLPYLKKAVSWAKNHGLKVIVDLHGAPGSQNGFDNSGRRINAPTWHTKASYISRTGAIIKTLANMFKDESSVVIAPLNEPAGFDGEDVLEAVEQYWKDSYGSIRFPYGSGKQSNTLELIHDAFQPLSYWQDFMPQPDFQGVAIDTHIYQVFSDDENRMDWNAHLSTACGKAGTLGDFSSKYLWTIVGEWSLASTDCAKYLNGRGVGARYDGSHSGSSYIGSCSSKTGSGSSFSNDYKTFLRKFFEAQRSSYEAGAGWVYWTWKAENADDWSYQAGLKYGWIPRNPTERKYPNVC